MSSSGKDRLKYEVTLHRYWRVGKKSIAKCNTVVSKTHAKPCLLFVKNGGTYLLSKVVAQKHIKNLNWVLREILITACTSHKLRKGLAVNAIRTYFFGWFSKISIIHNNIFPFRNSEVKCILISLYSMDSSIFPSWNIAIIGTDAGNRHTIDSTSYHCSISADL